MGVPKIAGWFIYICLSHGKSENNMINMDDARGHRTQEIPKVTSWCHKPTKLPAKTAVEARLNPDPWKLPADQMGDSMHMYGQHGSAHRENACLTFICLTKKAGGTQSLKV